VTDIELREALIAQSDAVILSLEIPLDVVTAVINLAQTNSTRIVLNPAPATFLSLEILAKISVLTPNEHEVGIVCGLHGCEPEIGARKLLDAGVENVVVTLGAAGAIAVGVMTDGALLSVPAEAAVHAIDTTGAGDCYTGALAVALSEGLTLHKAMEFAGKAAAISVTRRGAQSSMPLRSEIV
jgi:ribokinase